MSARKLIQSFGMAGLFILAGASGAFGQFSIDWHTVDGGGGISEGGGFTVQGTIGQPDAGAMAGGDYLLAGGFWPAFTFCFVDLDDWANFAGQWLLEGPDLPADIALDDEIVDTNDLLGFAEVFLSICPGGWEL